MTRASRAGFLATISLLLLSCGVGDFEEPAQQERATEIEPGFNLLKPEQDVEIGRASVEQIEQQLPLVENAQVQRYVESIGQELAAHAPGPRFPYRFRVVDASDLNAFALPGGPIYLNRGVIESAKSEGEVAGVLAHEIAHVALRHGTHNVSKAYLTRAGIGILGGLLGGDVSAGTAAIINIVGGVGLNALFLKYSRAAETQADLLGAQILARSGYNPADMIEFFRTLQQSEKRKVVGWLSDHPTPERRIERLEAEARALRPATKTRDASRLREVQAALRGLPEARTLEQLATVRAPQQVERRGGEAAAVAVAPPAATYVRYRSPDGGFEIEHPENWRLLDGTGGGVTFAPEGGVIRTGDSVEIVYGAVINHYVPFGDAGGWSGGGEVPLAEATRDLTLQIRRTSPHLAVVAERPTSTTSMITTLRGTSPVTRLEEEVRVFTTIFRDGHLMFMIFVTPAREAGNYNATFDRMAASLRAGGGH